MTAFRLSIGQLRDIRDALRRRILEGLAVPDREIKALPAYVRRPAADVSGEVVALDVGGTNMRAGLVRLERGTVELLRTSREDDETMEKATRGEIGAREFFDRQAELIAAVCRGPKITVGYCFSYPAAIAPECEAVLLRWTKGIKMPGVVGTAVGAALADACARKIRDKQIAGPIRVLNDTVATLVAAAFVAREHNHHIGLVAGTGTNMAAFFPVERIGKLASGDRTGWSAGEEMAVNLESGNFTPPWLTPYDHEVDSQDSKDESGRQRFEKAVSGAYLPRLLRAMIGDETLRNAGTDPDALDGYSVAALRERPDAIGHAASALIDRSADLVAAAVAGVIMARGPSAGTIGVLSEGGLQKTSGYRARIERMLADLSSPGTEVQLVRYPADYPEPNFLGAACVALQSQ